LSDHVARKGKSGRTEACQRAVLVIGAGRMALEYARVLQALAYRIHVIGRGASSARTFYKKTGIPVWTEGLDTWWKRHGTASVTAAIVAVNAEQLASVALALLRRGMKRILVEKPAGLNEEELLSLVREAEARRADVYVAYNRRHYASVLAARRMIEADGGVRSVHFDFTEYSRRIAASSIHRDVKEAWLVANSSHVIDLAFYLAGEPVMLESLCTGELPWHRRASRFCGCGLTRSGALFSYHANWEAPGNWSIEVTTAKRKMRLQPLEQLAVQSEEGGPMESISLDQELDLRFKPGLYRLVQTFLSGAKDPSLMPVRTQLERYRDVYTPMLARSVSRKPDR
jgi:predicted dehydrogenase